MVNGIINVYKEAGFTSFDVVAKMRGMFGQKKIGHTGTLDPDATGVLPVCLGRATKVCDILTDKDKVYEAVMLLGKETDTQDISGQVLNEARVTATEEEVAEAVKSFVGTYNQIPPMYSALKVNGQKLCDLARAGITVERKGRDVTIFDIDIISIELPRVKMRVHCSKGTYIRTLCKDIGDKLGCFACMESLVRTKVSCFELDKAYKLSELQAFVDGKRPLNEYMTEVDCLFDYDKVTAKSKADKLIANGNRIPLELLDGFDEKSYKNLDKIKFYNAADKFVGIFEYKEDECCIKPVKIFMEL